MKVLLVDPSLYTPPYDGALAAALAPRGHDVVLAARPPRPSDPPVGDVTLVPVFYRHGERWRGRLRPAAAQIVKGVEHAHGLGALGDLIRRFRPDVVHWQWPSLPALDARAVRRWSRERPQIVTVHDRSVFKAKSGLRRLQTLGWMRFLGAADELIAHVPSTRVALQRSGADLPPVHVVPHPIFERPRIADPAGAAPGDAVSEAAAQRHEPRPTAPRERDPHAVTAPLKVTFFGRLSDDKGLDVLASALDRLSDDDRQALRVRVYGRPIAEDPRVAAALDTLARLESVELRTGFVPEEALDALLADSDLVVLPHREVDASGMLMKALAYDVGLVVSDVPAFREVAGDGLGIEYFRSGDAAALATVLARLGRDPARCALMKRGAAVLRGGALSWARAAEATEHVYLRALDARRARGAPDRVRSADPRGA